MGGGGEKGRGNDPDESGITESRVAIVAILKRAKKQARGERRRRRRKKRREM